MKTKTKTRIVGTLIISLIFGFVCFEAWIATFLFNWVIGLFGCDFTLTFWQCVGICAILSFVVSFFKK